MKIPLLHLLLDGNSCASKLHPNVGNLLVNIYARCVSFVDSYNIAKQKSLEEEVVRVSNRERVKNLIELKGQR